MEIFPLLAFLVIGLFAGLIGSLLGLSGGVVTVPALLFIFGKLYPTRPQTWNLDCAKASGFDDRKRVHISNIDPFTIVESRELSRGPKSKFVAEWGIAFPENQLTHMAIGTSLASMIFNGIVSTWAHHRRNAVVWDFVRQVFLWIVLGSLIGAFVANVLTGTFLQVTFGIFVFLLGIYLFQGRKRHHEIHHPNQIVLGSLGLGIGAVASLLGIGGGVFSVPLLLSCHYSEKKAIGTSAAISLIITTVAALAYLYFGLREVKIPKSLGYIYLPAFGAIGIGGMVLAPLGAKWASEIDSTLLRRIFAGIMLIVGIWMILK